MIKSSTECFVSRLLSTSTTSDPHVGLDYPIPIREARGKAPWGHCLCILYLHIRREINMTTIQRKSSNIQANSFWFLSSLMYASEKVWEAFLFDDHFTAYRQQLCCQTVDFLTNRKLKQKLHVFFRLTSTRFAQILVVDFWTNNRKLNL